MKMYSKLVCAGLAAAVLSSFLGLKALADDAAKCPGVPNLPGVTAYYDTQQRLVQVNAPGETLHVFYTKDFAEFGHTAFKLKLEHPNRMGQTEIYGPVRGSVYDLRTGEILEVHTFEKMKINPRNGHIDGVKTIHHLPEVAELQKLKEKDASGRIVYEGVTEYESASSRQEVSNCKPRGSRVNFCQVEVIEPLNFNDIQCYAFHGGLFPMKRPAISAQKSDDMQRSGKTICMKDGSGCITIHDDAPNDEPAEESYESVDDEEPIDGSLAQ